MRTRRRFCPTLECALEGRVATSSFFSKFENFFSSSTLFGLEKKKAPIALYIHEENGTYKHIANANARALSVHNTLYTHQSSGVYRPYILPYLAAKK